MQVVILAIGVLQVIGGVLFFVSAKSAIHEILGSLTFGLGILSIALATALSHLDAIEKATEQAAANGQKLATLQGKVSDAFDRIGR